MEILKKLVNSLLLVCIASIVIGVLLIIDPKIFTHVISYVIGGVILAFGALNLISFFASDRSESSIINAIILCITGTFIIVRPDFIFNVLAFAFGLVLLGEGLISLKRASVIKTYNPDKWFPSMVMAILTTILGFIVILNPFLFASTSMRILGVLLIISAIFTIYNGLFTKKEIKRIEKKENADYIDIE